jgi:LacI family transcriptional regulator
MVTMREVAAKAGVSAKTVSRVFNGDRHVLPDTRAHVERIMQELNYVPNVLATTFRAGRSPAIGVAVPDIVDPFFAQIIRSVNDVAHEHGMSTLVTNLGEESEDERASLESLLSRQLSGLVVAPVGTDHSWLKRWQQHTTVVFVDRQPFGISADTFTENDEGGAFAATSHLIEHGHARIAYVGDAIHLSTETNRLKGWRRAHIEHGLDPDDELIAVGISDLAKAHATLERLARVTDPPTAIFSSNARCSMTLAHALQTAPIAMVGFGDFPLADLLHPSMTVIDQDPALIGRLAAERVIDRLQHPNRRFKKKNVLDVAMIERSSCKVGDRGQSLDAVTDVRAPLAPVPE